MSDLERAVQTVVGPCLGVQPGEDVVIVVDSTTERIGAALREAAAAAGGEPVVCVMEPREVDGQEPPAAVAAGGGRGGQQRVADRARVRVDDDHHVLAGLHAEARSDDRLHGLVEFAHGPD